jgi:hypothetical protein
LKIKRGYALLAAVGTSTVRAWEMHPRPPRRVGLLYEAAADILAYMDFPAQRPAIIHPTNPTWLCAGRFDPIKNRTKGALVHVLIRL